MPPNRSPIPRTLVALSLALSLAATLAPPVQAQPVTYAFQGLVDDDDGGRALQSFSGSFVFDSAAVDTIAQPDTAAYAHSGAPYGLALAFDDGSALALHDSLHLLVGNNLGGQDFLGVLAQDGTQSVSLSLTDSSGQVLASDGLPLPPGGLTLAGFDASVLRWETAGMTLQGRLTQLACTAGCDASLPPGGPPSSPVPEPGSALLLATGLLAAGASRLRRPASRTAQADHA